MGTPSTLPQQIRLDVLDAVEAGEAVRDVAKRYGIHQSTVSRWWTASGRTRNVDWRGTGQGRRPDGEIEAVYELFARHLEEEVTQPDGSIIPISVRRFCYRMTKRMPGFTKDDFDIVADYLVRMREQGIIPFDFISDSTRGTLNHRWATDAGHAVGVWTRSFELDLMAAQAVVIEVWSESDSIARAIAPRLDMYGVPVRYSRGHDTVTGVQEAAERFVRALRKGKPVHVLHVGDWDLAGLTIFDSLVERLHTYTWAHAQDLTVADVRKSDPDVRVQDLSVERMALTEQQVSAYGLTTVDFKPKHPNAATRQWVSTYGAVKAEAEAMETSDLVDILISRVRDLIDIDIWKAEVEREQREQQALEDFAAGWGSK